MPSKTATEAMADAIDATYDRGFARGVEEAERIVRAMLIEGWDRSHDPVIDTAIRRIGDLRRRSLAAPATGDAGHG